MNPEIREHILLADVFRPTWTNGRSVSGFLQEVPALLNWTDAEVEAELQTMLEQGLLIKQDPSQPWFYSTLLGQVERERLLRRLHRRADCLCRATEFQIDDLVLALVASNSLPFAEEAIKIHLFDRAAEVPDSVDRLLAQRNLALAKPPFFRKPGRGLRMLAAGLREFRTKAFMRLGLPDEETSVLKAQPEKVVAHRTLSLMGIDPKLVDALSSRIAEAEACMRATSFLAATILYGSVLEGVLVGLAKKDPAAANRAASAPKDTAGSAKPFREWRFVEFIKVAVELGWIPRSVAGHVDELRDSRNLVHVQQQVQDDVVVDKYLTRITREVVEAVLEGIQERISPPPP